MVLREKLEEYTAKGLHAYIFQTYLESKVPKFLYFDEFYQMEGQVNIESLIEADKTFTELLGKDPATRYKFIMESANQVEAEELDV